MTCSKGTLTPLNHITVIYIKFIEKFINLIVFVTFESNFVSFTQRSSKVLCERTEKETLILSG
jgi:hypothetical protein